MSTQALPQSNSQDSDAAAAEEQLVLAVLDRVYAAWAANDADAFVEPYAEHATAQLPGSYLPSRDAIRATMAAVFAGELKGSRAVPGPHTVRFLDDTVAIVIGQGAVL